MPIDIVENDMERLCKETYWIHKLKTLNPYGLNTKVIFYIDLYKICVLFILTVKKHASTMLIPV
jgi:hypothetical protein